MIEAWTFLVVGVALGFIALSAFRWQVKKDIDEFKREMERETLGHLRNIWATVDKELEIRVEHFIRTELKRQWDNGTKVRRVP